VAYETIQFEVRERVAYVTLNRPEQLNALTFQMRAELSEAFDACAADDGVRVVVLAGSGRAFCAGVDLRDGSFEESPMESVEVRVRGDFRSKLTGMRKPTIAAVQGFALGGGCELALCCDLRVAADDAQFALPEINLGSIPAGSATQRLPRLIGVTRALELLMTGDRLPALEAYRLGLLNKVVPGGELADTASALARRLAAQAPLAIRYLREAVYGGLDQSLDDGIRLEAYLGGLLRTTDDRLEGLAAFKEKRKPEFQGR
jgi:enoyl-CoA hydratase/carnithine racemase